MRCCVLTHVSALRLLHRSQIRGGGSGCREANEVATEVGAETGLRVVSVVGVRQIGLEKPRPRRPKWTP